jgi:hypothetical protein
MRLPRQSPAVLRHPSPAALSADVGASGCDLFKKIRCAAAVAACVATCAGGPQACITCFASLGMSSCIDCL